MRLRNFCFFLMAVILTSCSSEEISQSNLTVDSAVQLSDSSKRIDFSSDRMQQITTEILVDSVLKVDNDVKEHFYFKSCKNWSLTSHQAKELILNLKPVNGHTWHNFYNDTECYMKGQINVDGKMVDFEINGGSWLVLNYPDTSIFYADEEGKYNKWFIESKVSPR